jgi:hypothetical protein
MPQKYDIIVAHPDDEVIFFSSILKSVSKIIICFNRSQDNTVNFGRETIRKKKLLKKTVFLNLDETNVFNRANWQFPEFATEGLVVSKNRAGYKKNFLNLKKKLSRIISKGNIIYTHNPWGEYGHEEHVQVFKAIKYFEKKLKLTIFVNNYVSNKSYNLMKMQKYLLSNIGQSKIIDKMLTNRLKNVYISNSCWTFDDFYKWPKNEIFFKLKKNKVKFNPNKKDKLIALLNYMPGNYKVNLIKKILSYVIPYNLKKKILILINNKNL